MALLLVERARETARIAGRLGEAAGGSGGLTVIEGPAGIGKTSLLQEVRAQAEQRGMRVLAGRGSELERDYAFGVLRQLLERPVAELDDGDRDRVLAGHAAHAAPLFDPSLAALSTEVLLHGAQWLLANLAERQPLVLVIDDAHWADETSIVALGYLARRLHDVPIAIVVATRPPPVDGCACLAALVADTSAEHLRPAPLSEDAVATVSGSDDPTFVRASARATGGNPFLLHELLRELGEERSAAAVAQIEPRDLGRQMLARLGDDARAFAWALAILGDRASIAECATLADIDAPEQAVEELIAAGVLADDARLQFRHPLIAAAVDAGLPPARRASWHARAAALLRDSRADVERVAVHVATGAPAGSAEVVDLLVEAAARATARAAPTSAVPLLRRALAEPPDPTRRVDLLLALAAALNAVGDDESPKLYAEAGATSNDPEVKTRALEARAWWWGMAPEGVPEDLAEVDALIASLDDERNDLRARLEAVRLSVAGRSRPAMAAAVERAEALGAATSPGARPETLASIAFWRLQHGANASDCIELARRAIAAAPRERFAIPSIWFPFAVGILQRSECLTEAADVARDMRDAARENGSPTWYALSAHLVARYVADAGDLGEAEAEISAAVEATAAVTHKGWMSVVPTGTLAYVLALRGRAADAERTLRSAGLHEALPDTRPLDQLLPIRALVRHAQGRHDEAHADLTEALRRYARRGPASINEHVPRVLLARVEHALGAHTAATTVADAALQSAKRWGTAGAIGEALHAQGLISADPDALRSSVDSLARSPLRVSHAAALVDLGALLRRQGARRDAREPLLAALELARECGADGLAARAGEELEATGATVPARAASGPDALTPSERRITQLAAGGATNKEIAQQLFLSVKTIEMHLGNAYRKLNIGTRRDLRVALEATPTVVRIG